MNQVNSSDIENINHTMYSDISNHLTSKRRTKHLLPRKTLTISAIVLCSFCSFIIIALVINIAQLKAEKNELQLTIDNMNVEMARLSSDYMKQSLEHEEVQEMLKTSKSQLQIITQENQDLIFMNNINSNKAKDMEEKLNEQIKELTQENAKLTNDKEQLRDITKDLAKKIEKHAKNGDMEIFRKIKKSLKRVKDRVMHFFF